MKLKLYIFICSVIIFSACNNSISTVQESAKLQNVTWTLESFSSMDSIYTPSSNQSYTIQFKDDSTFSGKSDCNEISGSYKTYPDTSLIINGLVTTKIFCSSQSLGGKYFEAISYAKAYKIENNVLNIYYGNNSKLNFIRK